MLLLGLAVLLLWIYRRGCNSSPYRSDSILQTRTGLLAVGLLALAFVSPLCALSASLFSARVVHHVVLVALAAPLLALALPSRSRRPSWVWLLVFSAVLSPPSLFMPTVLLLVTVLAILTLVLAKPPLTGIVPPAWLMEPQDLQWPLDVPR